MVCYNVAMRLCAVLLTVGIITFAQGVSPTRPTPLPAFPRRIILDTDPGIDDAMAVLLALRSPELKVEAITTVAGNVPVELGTENARKLVELAGRTDVIVAKGAARPLQRKLTTAEAIHGENGLGGVTLPPPKIALDPRQAVQVIHDLIDANPGQITLVPVGPLTNIAMSLLQYPDLATKIREIILMGGTVGAGNATPAAEANIHQDAEAARQPDARGEGDPGPSRWDPESSGEPAQRVERGREPSRLDLRHHARRQLGLLGELTLLHLALRPQRPDT